MQFRLRRAAAFVSSPIHLFYLWTCLVIFVSAANWADGTVAGAFSAPPCRSLQRLIARCQWVISTWWVTWGPKLCKVAMPFVGRFFVNRKLCTTLFYLFDCVCIIMLIFGAPLRLLIMASQPIWAAFLAARRCVCNCTLFISVWLCFHGDKYICDDDDDDDDVQLGN